MLEAESIRNSIAADIRTKLISLKIDGVTRLNRLFFGINIQYCHDSAIHLRNIVLDELTDSNTEDNLKNVIFDICKKFGIETSQIYTMTIDNGRNMVKAVKLMGKEINRTDVENEETKKDSDEVETEEDSDEEFDEDEVDLEFENLNKKLKTVTDDFSLRITYLQVLKKDLFFV